MNYKDVRFKAILKTTNREYDVAILYLHPKLGVVDLLLFDENDDITLVDKKYFKLIQKVKNKYE